MEKSYISVTSYIYIGWIPYLEPSDCSDLGGEKRQNGRRRRGPEGDHRQAGEAAGAAVRGEMRACWLAGEGGVSRQRGGWVRRCYHRRQIDDSLLK